MPLFTTCWSLVKRPDACLLRSKKIIQTSTGLRSMVLRNRIAHEYFGLSLSVIWEIVQTDLPHLEKQLAAWLDAKG
jgi:uncharacterized protein YutE (UPF0331/DUF86 family)